MIYDTIKLVDPLRFDRDILVEVLQRRIREAEHDKKRTFEIAQTSERSEEAARRTLNEDLTRILHGKMPRQYGEWPRHLGKYVRLCPHTPTFDKVSQPIVVYLEVLDRFKMVISCLTFGVGLLSRP